MSGPGPGKQGGFGKRQGCVPIPPELLAILPPAPTPPPPVQKSFWEQCRPVGVTAVFPLTGKYKKTRMGNKRRFFGNNWAEIYRNW